MILGQKVPIAHQAFFPAPKHWEIQSSATTWHRKLFIKAYTNLASFKNLSSFSTWLYRIAYNIFYDYIRSKKETSGLETWEIDAVYQTEQRQVGEHMDIYRGLSQLKEVERTCITLFFMEDLPIEKIAVITGMPAGTIKSHLSRGKTKLTTFLKLEWL